MRSSFMSFGLAAGVALGAAVALADPQQDYADTCGQCHGPAGGTKLGTAKTSIAGMQAAEVRSSMEQSPVHTSALTTLDEERLAAIAAFVEALGSDEARGSNEGS